MKWRLMMVEPRSGAENMARDAGLMDRARETGEAVFSVYSWARPTLSLGRNQTAADKYDLREIARRNWDLVRRPTGGRALLHHHEVTYSVAAPVSPNDSLSESYHRINSVLIDALASLGVKADEADAVSFALPPTEIPCFAEPARGELVFDGRKLVGSAQVREDGMLLQHGSILVENDQQSIAEVMLAQPSESVGTAATLTEALGRAPSISEVASALFASVMLLEDAGAKRIAEPEVIDFTNRHLEKFRSEWWTWRR